MSLQAGGMKLFCGDAERDRIGEDFIFLIASGAKQRVRPLKDGDGCYWNEIPSK